MQQKSESIYSLVNISSFYNHEVSTMESMRTDHQQHVFKAFLSDIQTARKGTHIIVVGGIMSNPIRPLLRV